MKIIRCKDNSGEIRYGCQHSDGTATLIDGCVFGDFTDTGEPLTKAKVVIFGCGKLGKEVKAIL